MFSLRRKERQLFIPPLMALGFDGRTPTVHHMHLLKSDEELHKNEPFEIDGLCGVRIEEDLCLLGSVDRLYSFLSVENDEEFLICPACLDDGTRMLIGKPLRKKR